MTVGALASLDAIDDIAVGVHDPYLSPTKPRDGRSHQGDVVAAMGEAGVEQLECRYGVGEPHTCMGAPVNDVERISGFAGNSRLRRPPWSGNRKPAVVRRYRDVVTLSVELKCRAGDRLWRVPARRVGRDGKYRCSRRVISRHARGKSKSGGSRHTGSPPNAHPPRGSTECRDACAVLHQFPRCAHSSTAGG